MKGKLRKNSIRTNFCIREEDDHVFMIIKGSGKKTGTPMWKCARCKRVVISS